MNAQGVGDARADARRWIDRLGLAPHPEGGHYRETYRSPELVAAPALPARYGGPRAFATAIYFLLERGQFSALHRLKSDEIWHFHAGGPLVVTSIAPGGCATETTLGLDLDAGQRPQLVVPAGHWFGARPAPQTEYALVGCTVAPGFDFADFEMAARADLERLFPHLVSAISALTRP